MLIGNIFYLEQILARLRRWLAGPAAGWRRGIR